MPIPPTKLSDSLLGVQPGDTTLQDAEWSSLDSDEGAQKLSQEISPGGWSDDLDLHTDSQEPSKKMEGWDSLDTPHSSEDSSETPNIQEHGTDTVVPTYFNSEDDWEIPKANIHGETKADDIPTQVASTDREIKQISNIKKPEKDTADKEVSVAKEKIPWDKVSKDFDIETDEIKTEREAKKMEGVSNTFAGKKDLLGSEIKDWQIQAQKNIDAAAKKIHEERTAKEAMQAPSPSIDENSTTDLKIENWQTQAQKDFDIETVGIGAEKVAKKSSSKPDLETMLQEGMGRTLPPREKTSPGNVVKGKVQTAAAILRESLKKTGVTAVSAASYGGSFVQRALDESKKQHGAVAEPKIETPPENIIVTENKKDIPLASILNRITTTNSPERTELENERPEMVSQSKPVTDLEGYAALEKTIQKNKNTLTVYEIEIGKNKKILESLMETEQNVSAVLVNETLLSTEENGKILEVIKEKRRGIEQSIKKVEGELELLKKELTIMEAKLALMGKENMPTASPITVEKAEEKPLFNKENLSPFEQGIVNQENIEGLAELLVSKEYKDHVFGGGTRAVTGTEMAKRISEKVLQAKKGAQVDPYFFIPDAILANKVHELLETSLSWQESVSEFGTLSFEKKDSEIKEEVAQKATEATIRKVAAVTNPSMWKKITGWIKTGGQTKELKATQVRTRFWASLGVALGLWGVTEAMDVEKTSTPVSTSTEATAETSQPSVKTQKIDKLFNEAKSSSVKASTSSAGISSQSKPDAQPLPTNAPAGMPAQPETNVTPITDTPDYISGQSVADTPDYISPKKEPSNENSPAEPEKMATTQEKPKQFYSINEMRNWFSQDKQKLAALERVLHYADGQEEEGVNGQPNVRAFWWETMQLQKVSTMLPNKANSQSRNLTREYRNYHIRESGSRDTIVELRGLDDNQFMTTGAKLRDFDVWCKNSLFPATQQLEQKITQEEKEVLANTTQTLGEYLTQVVYLGEKYGVQIKGLPTLTEAQQQKVQNFQPIKTENKIPSTNTENLASQERGVSPTENTYWADGALRGAELHGVGNNISNLEWLNGPFENMIRQYWDVQSDMKIHHRGYTSGELQYLKAQFGELRRRADWPSTQDSLREVDRVLADIETQLGAFQ